MRTNVGFSKILKPIYFLSSTFQDDILDDWELTEEADVTEQKESQKEKTVQEKQEKAKEDRKKQPDAGNVLMKPDEFKEVGFFLQMVFIKLQKSLNKSPKFTQ